MLLSVAQLRPHAVPRRAHGAAAHDTPIVATLALPGTSPARGLVAPWVGYLNPNPRTDGGVARVLCRRMAAARRQQAGRSSEGGDPSARTKGRALRVRAGATSMDDTSREATLPGIGTVARLVWS